MKTSLLLFGMVLLSVTAGCLGNGPRMKEIELTETQQRFKTETTFKDGVVSVEARRRDGAVRMLNTANHYEAEWGLLLPQPFIPGFVSREWILSENAHDGKTLLYTAVRWDDANPADYLAVGWWLHFPPGLSIDDLEEAERGVFIDGPEIDLSNPPEMPVAGEATYSGTTGGLYEYEYGSAWGALEGGSQYIEFGAGIELKANFSDQTIEGCIGCNGDIEIRRGTHLYPIVTWRTPAPNALPTDYDIHLGATPFNSDGTFESTGTTVTHPDRTVTRTEGLWAGQFSNVPDPDGNPRAVVGFGDIAFDEADDSRGRFEALFSTLTPATLDPERSEVP